MLHFIVNSGAKKLEELLAALKERLENKRIAYEIHSGKGKKETRELVGELSKAPATIVAVGGDGTLNDVVCGLECPENVELGLIPYGTGNDFAAAAKIPFGIDALDLILNTKSKFTDYIECGGMRSINIAGLGIDVDILERCRRKKGGKRNKYFRSLLASVLKYRGQNVKITVDGKQIGQKAYIAAICNGTQFGGGIPICPPALLDDGKLDLVVVDSPKWYKLLAELVSLMRGKILNRAIAHRYVCSEVTIEQENGTVVQFDGELVEAKTLTASVVSGKLRMFRG